MRLIVVGCGRWGAGLAHALGQGGHAVTVVDCDAAAFDRLGPGFRGSTVLGGGFDKDVLRQAGVERADGLAATTASDETNVVAARAAAQLFRVPRVVARLYDPAKAEIYRRLGLQTVAPAPWGIHRMAEVLLYSPLHAVTSLGTGEVDLLEVEVPRLLVGQPVSELTLPGEISVVAVTRADRTFLPSPGTRFRARDVLHVAALGTSAERLKELLGLT
ncbi:MAG: TrkA family potassium uptake protein [Deltaproteobacteria bacterium]|nr:TrkA family potassium uptake protein [Deltaproteobacteria bacterium]